MEAIFVTRITFTSCVFLTGIGLAITNIITHSSAHEGVYKYDGSIIIGSFLILAATILICAAILFA